MQCLVIIGLRILCNQVIYQNVAIQILNNLKIFNSKQSLIKLKWQKHKMLRRLHLRDLLQSVTYKEFTVVNLFFLLYSS